MLRRALAVRAAACWLRPVLALRPAPLALLARSPLPAFGRRLSTAATGEADVESLLDRWVGAKRSRNFVEADDLAKTLQQLGVNPHDARPDPRRTIQTAPQQGALDAATEAKLDQWVAAKVARDFAVSDRIRGELYAAGVDPAKARELEKHTWSGGLSSNKGRGPFDGPTEALLDAWVVAKRERDYASADDLAARLRARDIEPMVARPPPGANRRQQRGSAQLANPELGPFDFNTEEMLDGWVTARRTRNFEMADQLRDQLRAMNIEPQVSRPAPGSPPRSETRY